MVHETKGKERSNELYQFQCLNCVSLETVRTSTLYTNEGNSSTTQLAQASNRWNAAVVYRTPRINLCTTKDQGHHGESQTDHQVRLALICLKQASHDWFMSCPVLSSKATKAERICRLPAPLELHTYMLDNMYLGFG